MAIFEGVFMIASGVYLDMRDFNEKFRKMTEVTTPEAMRKGIFAAVSDIKLDADEVAPRTPVKEGHLKGSWMSEITYKSANEFSVLCGFNIEYAIFVHEMVKRHDWTEPGSGPKFLESKLFMFGNKYLEIIARVAESEMSKT